MIDTPAIEKLLGELEARIAASYQSPLPWRYAKHGYMDDLESDGGQVACFEIDDDALLAADAVNAIPTLITTIRALMEDNRRLLDAMERIYILTNSDWIEAADNPVKHMERVHSVAVDAFWHKPGEVSAIRSKGDA